MFLGHSPAFSKSKGQCLYQYRAPLLLCSRRNSNLAIIIPLFDIFLAYAPKYGENRALSLNCSFVQMVFCVIIWPISGAFTPTLSSKLKSCYCQYHPSTFEIAYAPKCGENRALIGSSLTCRLCKLFFVRLFGHQRE
jgi:hypothetical protein